MSTEDGARARGRPPVPSLSSEAVAILERNAFSALRGPNSRGAVPGALSTASTSRPSTARSRDHSTARAVGLPSTWHPSV